jgi:hypothetical protein
MKQSIILWTAAVVITFVAGFLQSRLSSEYPVSGSFGIEGKETGYKLDRVYYGNDDYKFFLRTESDSSLTGKVYWKTEGSSSWNSSTLNKKGEIISGSIPRSGPGTKVSYYVELNYKGKDYFIPGKNESVTMTFYGKVPGSISFFYWATLLGAVLLAVRTGLEYFRYPGNLKKIEVFTLIAVISNVFVFNSVRMTYKLGSVGKSVVSISDMFPVSSVLLLAVWIIATALIFNTKNFRIWAPAAALVTLLIFELGGF